MAGFRKIHLIVTGDTEVVAVPRLLGKVLDDRSGGFTSVETIDQCSPPKKKPEFVAGTTRLLPTKAQEALGQRVKKAMTPQGDNLVLVLDDVEFDRAASEEALFAYHRAAVDLALTPSERKRCGVFYFRMMLEAYFVASPEACAAVIGPIKPVAGDPEAVRNPAALLTSAKRTYDKIQDGAEIAKHVDLDALLSNPENCTALRSLVAWMRTRLAAGEPFDDRWQLATGKRWSVTEQNDSTS